MNHLKKRSILTNLFFITILASSLTRPILPQTHTTQDFEEKASRMQKCLAYGISTTAIATTCYLSPWALKHAKGIGTKLQWYGILGPIDKTVTSIEAQPHVIRSKQKVQNIFMGHNLNYCLTPLPKKITDPIKIKKRRKKRILIVASIATGILITGGAIVIYPPLGPQIIKHTVSTAKKYIYMRAGKYALKKVPLGPARDILFKKSDAPKRPFTPSWKKRKKTI